MARTGWGTVQKTFTKREKTMKASGDNTVYYGRYSCNGELVGAGKFIDYVLCLYGRDGKFHYDQRYDKMYMMHLSKPSTRNELPEKSE